MKLEKAPIKKQITYTILIVLGLVLLLAFLGSFFTPTDDALSPNHTPPEVEDVVIDASAPSPIPSIPSIPAKTFTIDLLNGSTLVAFGELDLQSNDHEISGRAGIYSTTEGELVQLERGFHVTQSPSLHIYAAQNTTPVNSLDELTNPIHLGQLAEFDSAIHFPFPTHTTYKTIILWDHHRDVHVATAIIEDFVPPVK